jgi:FkbM family methyltransferase
MGISQKLAGFRALMKFDNWPMLVLARAFDRETGLVTYRKGAHEILIDHRGGDENGTRACLVTDMYLKHLSRIATNGAVRVLDLGANGGGFPLMLVLNGFNVEQAVCVEMNPHTCLRLLVNLATNLDGKATGLNAAICASYSDEGIQVERSRGSTSQSMYAQPNQARAAQVSVPTTTIARLLESYFPDTAVDICKIDIEGAEYDALMATPNAVLEKIRNVIIEFHDPIRTPVCVKRLEDAGFRETTGNETTQTGENTEVRVFSRAERVAA